ncbi:hypothetical protein ABZX75_06810 [Streptomyces sp. NPDC003038]|uniref:hypothetical protein n=1 Tax=unclassified Streptomyces TaxID=2593676 RepID=UPI0033B6266A
MNQGFRPARRLACAALAAAALATAAPAYAVSSFGPALAPATGAAAPAAPTPPAGEQPPEAAGEVPQEVYEQLAGSAAGVGRERPGRPAAEPPDQEMVAAARPRPVRPRTEPVTPPPVATPSPPPETVTAIGTERNDRAADLAAHILPLGTGFALMGVGLGYLGMRLRRGI